MTTNQDLHEQVAAYALDALVDSYATEHNVQNEPLET